jgi:hypothetical protein
VTAVLGRLAFRKAIGLHVGEQEIVLSQVALTPLGPVETATRRVSYGPDELKTALERLVGPFLGKWKRLRTTIAVTLPSSRIFFATRPLWAVGADTSAELLLQRALQLQTINIDEFIVEQIKSKINKAPIASIAACRRKHLGEVLAALEHCQVRPFRVEPAPWAVMRVASRQGRTPRRAKMGLRVLLSDNHGLGIVAAGDLPLAWRPFRLLPGCAASEVLSVKRLLQSLVKHFGIETPIDAVLIHGRPDLHASLQGEDLIDDLECPVQCHKGPALDGASIAFGAALGCLAQNQPAFDFSHSLKPKPSILEIFPFGELAIQCALVAVMALVLFCRGAEVDHAYRSAQLKKRQHTCLTTASPAELEKEKKDLQQRVDTIRKFVDSRVLWTAYTCDLPARLPPAVEMTCLQGVAELASFAKKDSGKAKKSLVLRGTAPLPPDGSTPKEIDIFLASLRNHPLLKQDFPDVKLADIKRFVSFSGSAPMATFTVLCLPGASTPPAKTGVEKKASK